MAAPKRINDEEEYFKRTYTMYFFVPVFTTFTVALYAPGWLTWHFGPLGTFAKYCVANHFYWTNLMYGITFWLHVFDALVALFVCWLCNMSTWTSVKWLVNSGASGVESTYPLIMYYRESKGLNKKQK